MGASQGSDRRRIRLATVALILTAIPGAAWARDLPPLPFPLPCPLDVPVRVASEDTLKRFTALDDCTAEKVIVAPREAALPVRAPTRFSPEEEAKTRLVRAERRRRGKVGDTSVETAELGRSETRVVRIIPVLPDPPPVAPLITVDAAPAGDVSLVNVAASDEMVLGLRPASYTTSYDAMITNAAVRHRVDPLMLHSVIKQEFSYRPQAVSHAGARGLMQIMPGTGADLGVANAAYLMDPATNIDAGARLLRRLWDKMGGRFDLVLAAYNAGEGAVRRFGMQVPPFAETRDYVARVQGIYRGLATGAGLLGGR